MQELEVIQPEESQEGSETVENAEAQALQDAAVEPGARIEETQTFEQAEAVEGAVQDAMQVVEDVAATPINIPKPGEEAEAPGGGSPGGDVAATPINLPYTPDADVAGEEEASGGEVAEAVSAEEVRASLSAEQQEALSGLNPKDQEDLLRVIGQSQRILPDQLPGHSGGLIY